MEQTVGLLARLIEALAGLVVGWAMLRAVTAGGSLRFRNAGLRAMRRELAGGVVAALGLMTAATLLKTITLASWSAIGMFAVVLALRTLVKRVLAAETGGKPLEKRRHPELVCPPVSSIQGPLLRASCRTCG